MVDGAPHSDLGVAISDPVYTRDGRLAYAGIGAPDGRVSVLVDGRTGPLADDLLRPQSTIAVFEDPRTGYSRVPFTASPDGGHVAWAGQFGDQSRPVLDDRVGPAFDTVHHWSFDASGAAAWWAQRADTIYRVTAPAQEA